MNAATQRAPQCYLTLDRRGASYAPGDDLEGRLQVENWEALGRPNVELSVVWYTVGQGEEDLSVHYFQRFTKSAGVDLAQPTSFTTELPAAPLSYDGLIVKVCWSVRLRVAPSLGRGLLIETPLRLGGVQMTPNTSAPRP